MPSQKQYNVQIFDLDGTTLLYSVPPNILKDRAPSFTSRINAGLGECILDLNLPFDNFGYGTRIKNDAIVEIWSVDDSFPLGRRIYKGYISKIAPKISGSWVGVSITCLGLGSLLTHSLYRNGASDTVTHTAVDPQAIAEAIITHFNTIEGGALISYTHDTSTELVGTNVTKVFTDKTWFDAMTDCLKLASSGFWWSVDRDGLLSFKSKPSSATHQFVIQKHIETLDAPRDSEGVYNDIEVRWSGGTTLFTDASSQAEYGHGSGTPTGKRTKILSDSSVTSSGGADQVGNKFLAENKDAQVKVTCTVNQNYDIDSIKVGDTCTILNYDIDFAFIPSNMQIVGMSYNGDTVDLDLESPQANLGVVLDAFVNG